MLTHSQALQYMLQNITDYRIFSLPRSIGNVSDTSDLDARLAEGANLSSFIKSPKFYKGKFIYIFQINKNQKKPGDQ